MNDGPANPVTAQELVSGLEFVPFDRDELEADGAVVVDAVVCLRYQAPDWPHPRLTYASTQGMDTAVRYGIVGMVWDRITSTELDAWDD